MTKLTDTHLVLLSAASQRPDGVIPINERLKGSVAKAVGDKLMALGLAEEQVVLPSMNGWRENADGQSLALVITVQGLAAVGIEADDGSGGSADSAVTNTSIVCDAIAAQATAQPAKRSSPSCDWHRSLRIEEGTSDRLTAAGGRRICCRHRHNDGLAAAHHPRCADRAAEGRDNDRDGSSGRVCNAIPDCG